MEHTEDIIPDSRRKFHMWRANTSNLIINVMSLDNNSKDSESQFVDETVHDITQTLSHFSTSYVCEIRTGLVDIIYKSLTLDEELSRQAVAVTFSFCTGYMLQP